MVANSTTAKVRISEGGFVAIPAEFRRSLGLEVGQDATLEMINGALVLMNPQHVIRSAQELVRKNIPDSTSRVDQLIAERRADLCPQ